MSLPCLEHVMDMYPEWAQNAIHIFQNQESYTFRNVFESSRPFNCYIELTIWGKTGELERTRKGFSSSGDIPTSSESFDCDADARHITARLPGETVYWTFPDDRTFWLAVCILCQAVDYIPEATCLYDGFTNEIRIPVDYAVDIIVGYKSRAGLHIEKYNDRGRKIDDIQTKKFELSYDAKDAVLVSEFYYSDHITVNKDYCYQDWTLYMSTNPSACEILIEDDFGEYAIWKFHAKEDYLSALSFLHGCIYA